MWDGRLGAWRATAARQGELSDKDEHAEGGVEAPSAELGAARPRTAATRQLRDRSPWQMGLVVTASALCGGIAVVLWNRRFLARMRESRGESAGTLRAWETWEDDA